MSTNPTNQNPNQFYPINKIPVYTGNPKATPIGFDIVNTVELYNSNPTAYVNSFYPLNKAVIYTGDPKVTLTGFDIKTTKETSNDTNTTLKGFADNALIKDNPSSHAIEFGQAAISSLYSLTISKQANNDTNPTINTLGLNITDANLESLAKNPLTRGSVTFSPITDSLFNIDTARESILSTNTTDNYNHTNRDATNITDGLVTGINSIAGAAGLSQVSQFVSLAAGDKNSKYATLSHDQLYTALLPYTDFRARRILSTQSPAIVRADGTAATFRKFNATSVIYASLSATTGPYTLFNVGANGPTGYGMGEPGQRFAIRNDFTLGSVARKRWDDINKKWKGPGIVDALIPFRGDQVNVIDFKKDATLDSAYIWRDAAIEAFGGFFNKTNDFIKFFFTGPKLYAGNTTDTDDIIVFRAAIKSLTDRFNPDWEQQQMIGRADPNYTYKSYTRDLDLNFMIYATDRDEVQPIWRKLNAIAGYTTPSYESNGVMQGPWMRITIGDLFIQQPAFITSLSYTLQDADTSWEINIENDATMMQVPRKIEVQMSLTLVLDYLPRKGGRFYTLAKEFDKSVPKKGNSNWLSDFLGNEVTTATGTAGNVTQTQERP